jgi:hypothetical protein
VGIVLIFNFVTEVNMAHVQTESAGRKAMITKQGTCRCEQGNRKFDKEWNWSHRKYQAFCRQCGELAHKGKLPLFEWLAYLFPFF